jgi:hypothetical protein
MNIEPAFAGRQARNDEHGTLKRREIYTLHGMMKQNRAAHSIFPA